MKKKTKYRFPVKVFSVFDRVTFFFTELVCILVAAAGLFLFNRNSMMLLENSDEVPVGIVSEKVKTCRRRFAQRNVWGILIKNSYVYNGDIIFTDKNSQIRLEFDNGVELTLLENTMTQISFDDNELKIGLDTGNIVIDSRSDEATSTVTYNGSSVRIASKGTVGISEVRQQSAGAASVNAPSNAGETGKSFIEIKVYEGSAGLSAGTGSVVELYSNQKAVLSEPVAVMPEYFEIRENIQIQEIQEIPSYIIVDEDEDIFKSNILYLDQERNVEIIQQVAQKLDDRDSQLVFDRNSLNSSAIFAFYGMDAGSVNGLQQTLEMAHNGIETGGNSVTDEADGLDILDEGEGEADGAGSSAGEADSLAGLAAGSAGGSAATTNSSTATASGSAASANCSTATASGSARGASSASANSSSRSSAGSGNASRSSSTQQSQQTQTVVLGKPALSSPKSGRVFDDSYFLENVSITFNWNAAQNADAYVFVLKDSSGKILLEKDVAKATQFVLSDLEILVADTSFTWSVRAERKSGSKTVDSKESQSLGFKIQLGEISGQASTVSGNLYGR